MSPRRIRGRKFYSDYRVKPNVPQTNLKKDVWSGIIIPLILIPIISLLVYWDAVSDNRLRQQVAENPATISGVITYIRSTGKGSRYAKYEFYLRNRRYEGETFHEYSGRVNDAVKVIYNVANPEVNIISSEEAEESLDEVTKKRVVPGVLILLALVLFYVCVVWFVQRRNKVI
jgi:hypothetical protein